MSDKEVVRKPFIVMSQREKDTYLGERRDIAEEKKLFEEEYGDEQLLEGIFELVGKMVWSKTPAERQAYGWTHLVAAERHIKPCTFVAKYFGLELICSRRMPDNEFSITSIDKVEKLIKSREDKAKAKQPIVLMEYGSRFKN